MLPRAKGDPRIKRDNVPPRRALRIEMRAAIMKRWPISCGGMLHKFGPASHHYGLPAYEAARHGLKGGMPP